MNAMCKKIGSLILALVVLGTVLTTLPAFADGEPMITAPASGSLLEVGQNVTIVVNAGSTAADRVEFYVDGVQVGESTQSGDPFNIGEVAWRCDWMPAEYGTHTLTARVYSGSAMQETAPITIYAGVSSTLGTRGTQFENMTVSDGVVTSPNVSGHSLTKPDTVTFSEAEVDTEHGKSLQMTSTAASISGNTAFLNIDGIGGAAGEITVAEFEVRFSKPAMGFYAGLHDGTGFRSDFTLLNGSFPEAAGGIYQADTWYQVRLVVNTATGRYDAYVNGEQRISGMTTTLTRLNRIKWEFRQDASASEQEGENITYLDNFRFATLQPAPEPITPVNGSDLEVGQNVAITVEPGSTATRVVFYANGVLLGESSERSDPYGTGASTYRYNWTPSEPGEYVLTAGIYNGEELLRTEQSTVYAREAVSLERDNQFENMTADGDGTVTGLNVYGYALTQGEAVTYRAAQVDEEHGTSLQMKNTAASISSSETFLNITSLPGQDGDVSVAEFEVRFSKPTMGVNFVFFVNSQWYNNFSLSDGSFPVDVGGTYAADTWYQIRFVINSSTGQYDVYVNGEQRSTGQTTTMPRLNRVKIEFRQNAAADGSDPGNSVYLDNFRFATLQIPDLDIGNITKTTETDGTSTVSVQMKTNDGVERSAVLIIGAYDENDGLLAVAQSDSVTFSDEADLSAKLERTDYSYLKAFLWDGINSLVPYQEAEVIPSL